MPSEVDAFIALDGEIGVVSGPQVLGGDSRHVMVDIHELRHDDDPSVRIFPERYASGSVAVKGLCWTHMLRAIRHRKTRLGSNQMVTEPDRGEV